MDNLGGSPLSSQVQQAQSISQQLSRQEVKKGRNKKVFILLIILLLAATGIFLIFKGISGSSEAIPSPTDDSSTPRSIVNTSSPEPSASPTAKPKVDKSAVKISIQNGTGVAGEAKLLQTKLEKLGYSKIESANAATSDHEATTVSFGSTMGDDVINEITTLLKDTYTSVTDKPLTVTNVDVLIITGLRSGQTSKPTSSPKASATPSSGVIQ